MQRSAERSNAENSSNRKIAPRRLSAARIDRRARARPAERKAAENWSRAARCQRISRKRRPPASYPAPSVRLPNNLPDSDGASREFVVRAIVPEAEPVVSLLTLS